MQIEVVFDAFQRNLLENKLGLTSEQRAKLFVAIAIGEMMRGGYTREQAAALIRMFSQHLA